MAIIVSAEAIGFMSKFFLNFDDVALLSMIATSKSNMLFVFASTGSGGEKFQISPGRGPKKLQKLLIRGLFFIE